MLLLFPAIETTIISYHLAIYELFSQLQLLIQQRLHPFYVGHSRGHSTLPGALSEGGNDADKCPQIIVALAKDEASKAHKFCIIKLPILYGISFPLLENKPEL